MLVTHLGEKLEGRSDVPLIIAPGKEEEYRRAQQKKKKKSEQKPPIKPQTVQDPPPEEKSREEIQQSEGKVEETQPEQTNMSGWESPM